MSRSAEVSINALDGDEMRATRDTVAVEEPLELRLRAGGETRTLAITMRTPGNDLELAAGFALGEGLIRARADLAEIVACDDGVPVDFGEDFHLTSSGQQVARDRKHHRDRTAGGEAIGSQFSFRRNSVSRRAIRPQRLHASRDQNRPQRAMPDYRLHCGLLRCDPESADESTP